ncbi:MAG TPA: hypothetical protein VHX52_01705 [Steroidobacteraceae bacterium]|jgi:hypothetical protein|nr:hypothetical protein [Steroidobacteraceae bacterium]
MRYRSQLVAAALCAALLLTSAVSWAQISISVNLAPPPLPVYTQPPLPQPGYLWVPGYWAWADGGYYWVPGTWIEPPQPGLLWTPGYWGWSNGAYLWHDGYWAPEVGFYGGVNYGFGYDGVGFAGGYWLHGAYFYNRAVNRFPAGMRIPHAYSRPIPQHVHSRASFNGGRGGIQARPTTAQLAAGRGAQHFQPIAAQRQQEQAAQHNPGLRAATNHGRPSIGATARPGQFNARPAAATHNAGPAAHDNVHGNVHGNVHVPERERASTRPAPAPHAEVGPGPGGPRAEGSREARPVARPAEHPAEHPAERPVEHATHAPAHAAPRPPARPAKAAPAPKREPQGGEHGERPQDRQP